MRLLSFVIIEKNNRFLLVCEASSKWKGKWFFPGGKLMHGEDPVTTALRESKEEAKCKVLLDGICYFKFYKGFLKNELQIFYRGRTEDAIIKTTVDEHSMGTKWFTYEELSQLPLRQNALQIIDAYRALNVSLPIYSFHFINNKTPIKIPEKAITSI